MNIIEFKSVSKRYKVGNQEIEAVKHVSFNIESGEFVVVLGASGAGKSTILNLLGGMDTVSEGQILVEGQDIVNFSEKELTKYRAEKIGFVFQFYNLISNLNTLENVEFAIEVSQKSLNPKDILKRVGLSERLKNFPSQLSGGEQQRVSIARAIAKNPLLLLCDEPTGALDYETGKEVLQLIKELNESTKKSVVLITHNSAISKIADKVIHVRSGQIEKIEYNSDKIPVSELEW
ncbi:mutanobactin A system ABC transporter ATP-binding subunit MubX [Streptococcus mutans]|jgi:putative ABC transporter, ATP-binding protein|uniref:ABC transporter ATP-binding protein n=1 Tax=Streptococcus mutans serotype c (strain ATCC 700610 / UA159) TaxID=210007 RepID=Q8CM14_STRMU|nr:mutanobactin A system ABC transporter ATP-binding subunit MubX [Streptococcus mutans]AAN59021.1 putative ABC transporter, ATP-binding protein [Streptococcus mutans UA159]AAN59036.1 putative ABC transporter; ATP-binding protein [Streptococcus mutans UA159]AJD55649.1 ABC transporter ATP-binding protein [Streptococcus mutans UA159-FR]AJD55659.1 ABC transporter ATP-binding protein [Streptococcus mutans UA159-FR]EMB61468.1 putative ABC transporter [Streptococcus mutans 8ID3]